MQGYVSLHTQISMCLVCVAGVNSQAKKLHILAEQWLT